MPLPGIALPGGAILYRVSRMLCELPTPLAAGRLAPPPVSRLHRTGGEQPFPVRFERKLGGSSSVPSKNHAVA